MALTERLEAIYQDVIKRNPGEAEFHQAVKEVLDSLGPVLVKYPEFAESKVIERISNVGQHLWRNFQNHHLGRVPRPRCRSGSGRLSSGP